MLNKTYTLALMLGLTSMVQSYCVDTAAGYNGQMFLDKDGNGCEWYNDPSWNIDGTGCGKHDDDDFQAREMCCGCGGGELITCDDTAGDLVDKDGDGCEWYNNPAKNVDGTGCGKYDTDDFKADEVCCGCGGGDRPNDDDDGDDTKDLDCDLETIYWQYRPMPILRGWHENQHVSECIDDDFMVKMFQTYFLLTQPDSPESPACDELQYVMVEWMEQNPGKPQGFINYGINWNGFIDHIQWERPWMELHVKILMAMSWNTCFPGFYEQNLDEVFVDDVRNLVPYYARPDPSLPEILNNSDLLVETLTN